VSSVTRACAYDHIRTDSPSSLDAVSGAGWVRRDNAYPAAESWCVGFREEVDFTYSISQKKCSGRTRINATSCYTSPWKRECRSATALRLRSNRIEDSPKRISRCRFPLILRFFDGTCWIRYRLMSRHFADLDAEVEWD
jgi:hypothetical protein